MSSVSMKAYELVFVEEPEGALSCNTCQDWSADPWKHAAEVHGVTDPGDWIVVLAEDV